MTPMTGFHSVIERPERVSRVIPPTTTIKKIIKQQTNSHAATGACPSRALRPVATPGFEVVAAEVVTARDPLSIPGK